VCDVFRPANPGQVIATLFLLAILVGTALLSLPVASASGQRTDLIDALFTATSAVCVTGLVTVDTGSYWSGFGQIVILALIKLGGLGVMTAATVAALLFFDRLGIRTRAIVQAETKALSSSDLKGVVRRVVIYSVVVEVVLSIILATRFALAYDYSTGTAVYHGIFHAVSAFNNAGFALYSDSLVGFVSDAWILLPIAGAVIIGGLGFPVVFELVRSWRTPRLWSVLTRITVGMTAVLLVLGFLGTYLVERGNPETLGGLSGPQATLAAAFSGVMPRTAGFNAIDIAALRPESLVLTDFLMFIGGGSAGTAGGIKVTTLGLLLFVVWAELRGRPDVTIGRRRVTSVNQRQALSVIVLAAGVVAVAYLTLLALTDAPTDDVLFETVSAFGTVGLSTGLTPELPDAAKLVVIALMFIGRVGPLTFATALALREHPSRVRLPEERLIVG
jgi:trk system potassium uptake protein TrkH